MRVSPADPAPEKNERRISGASPAVDPDACRSAADRRP